MHTHDIPRFNFIEMRKDQSRGCIEHTYFVTTDVNEAADHYLHRLHEKKSVYMTISTIEGRVCVAKSHGLKRGEPRPELIRMHPHSSVKTFNYKLFTDDFVKLVEKKLG